ncbi:hypothetical protein BS47DRAFT_1341650 [Hydnum rufescens UP504]|uniref:Uncharacterized protein n=1 Tax=Hydnum rufescens UP504 TaxID=1448309 RepID=A0A9P6DVV7_9AGAM|nr:hypothetical protein BS47DRAFT_1341650 [Hydnum rufescens UP504]
MDSFSILPNSSLSVMDALKYSLPRMTNIRNSEVAVARLIKHVLGEAGIILGVSTPRGIF